MMKRRLLCSVCCVVIWLAGPSLAQALSINVYSDRTNWEGALSGSYLEESFGDAILNTGLTVVSDMGSVDTGNGRWWDRASTSNNWTTTFSFTNNIFAFGAEWNLAGPGGSGQGLLITLPYSTGSTVLSIDRSNPGNFWGFVSDTGFNSVTIQGWTQSGWAETYEMDNLVYTDSNGLGGVPNGSGGAVPEPHTLILLGSGLGGLWVWRLRKGRAQREN